MQAIKLTCRPRNRFRLGARDLGVTSRWLHSDTLFSALINAHALLHGRDDATQLIETFRGRRAKISSAFYLVEFLRAGNLQKRIFFLPRIFGLNLPAQSDQDEFGVKKKVKRLEFLSLAAFTEMLQTVREENGEPVFAYDLLDKPQLGDHFIITQDEKKELAALGCSEHEISKIEPYEEFEAPRVNLQKTGDPEAGPFYVTDVHLNSATVVKTDLSWQAHFYFLLNHRLEDDEASRFFASLRLLADEGIGGERSTGAGGFTGFEMLDFPWELRGPYQTNLSLVSPLPEELPRIVSYDAIVRGGYAFMGEDLPHLEKQRVRLIKEGAIFRGEMKGRLVQVGDVQGIPVYQNGINFGLGFGGQS